MPIILATLTATAPQAPTPRVNSGRTFVVELSNLMHCSIGQMPADYSRIFPYALAAVLVYMTYRRFRRNFGRQRIRPLRLGLRILLLSALGCALAPLVLKSTAFLSAELAGAVVGIGLAVWGAARTRYETFDGSPHYIPHTYTGVALSLLVLGRLVYRFVEWRTAGALEPTAAAAASGFAPSPMVGSPLTVALLFVLIGYYVVYYGNVLWKFKFTDRVDLKNPSTPAPR